MRLGLPNESALTGLARSACRQTLRAKPRLYFVK